MALERLIRFNFNMNGNRIENLPDPVQSYDAVNKKYIDSIPFTSINKFVFNEPLTGDINGSNATFTTQFQFIPETLKITINGLEQKAISHYNTVGNDTITFSDSPQIEEVILVDYIKL